MTGLGVGRWQAAPGHIFTKEVVWALFSHFSKLALTGCWGWEQGTVLLGLRDSPGALIGPPQFALACDPADCSGRGGGRTQQVGQTLVGWSTSLAHAQWGLRDRDGFPG